MKFTNIVLAFALALGLASQAFAKGGGSGFTVIPSFGYNTYTDKPTPGTESKLSFLSISGKVGYTMSSGLYFGGIYNTATTTIGTGTGSETTMGGMGASIGWIHSSGFNIIGSYLLMGSGERNSAPKLEYDGTGMLVDVGYSFMFGNWGFGPQISYASYSFDEVKLAGAVVAGVEQEFNSMGLGLQFLFLF